MNNQVLEINEDFQRAFDLMEETSNYVFVTGKAGTGKSTLLKYFVQNTKKIVVLLAPTGVAALNIGGVTIHSFFRFPPRPITDEDIHQYPDELYKVVDTIVIDEISMVRSDMLDAIDKFMRVNGRIYSEPFGGIQVLFFGDLYQLSPIVSDKEEAKLFESYYDSPWFFDSKVIKEIDLHVIELKKVYRQTDEHFIEILDSIRTNKVRKPYLDELNKRIRTDQDGLDEPIILTCTNKHARQINYNKLGRITFPAFLYMGKIQANSPKKHYLLKLS